MTMSALVYTGTMQTEFRTDMPEPAPRAGQVVVDIALCGLCGSDMHAWHGHDERRVPPLVLGHEAVGIAADGKHAGKRVAINPLMTCGKCPACKSGAEHLCGTRELAGLRQPGGFAERMAIDETNLTPISDGLSYTTAALAEPLACAVHAVRLCDTGANDGKVVILGGGAIGLLAALTFRHYGFASVAIAETNPHRRTMIDALAIAPTYDANDNDDASVDIVFDAVGTGATRAAASRLAKPGGRIIHIGLENADAGLDTRRLTLQEISFTGSYGYSRDDFRLSLELLESGAVTPDGWTETMPLDEGGDAFRAIDEGRAPPKIILACGQE